MTEPLRTGSTRAARPAALRAKRARAMIIPAVAGSLALALGLTLAGNVVSSEQVGGDAQAATPAGPSVEQIVAEGAQDYSVNLSQGLQAPDPPKTSVGRGADGVSSEVVKPPEPKPKLEPQSQQAPSEGQGSSGNVPQEEARAPQADFVAPSPGSLKAMARELAASRGWGDDQFACLDKLWMRESGWRVDAENPSGAYGIPQALPGSKMGPGWRTDAGVQIRWGLGYIAGRYGTPCGALAHSDAHHWY